MTTIFTWNLETMEVAPEENGLTDVVKLLHKKHETKVRHFYKFQKS